ncbi:hypothetical protein DPM19_22295 [Actinomadura craniellae]|uniref:Metalloprotease n=1 Tax=Actinomadura craniellae TaxID=2231787 RepID=A0A365H2G5_9ACTN|nr:neutral zinc metallopeptidase [Actinomadura craniellae]RAY13216.1 hypothetical protein DPM19_22295 [Actinomadura craniellae]
MRFTSHLPLAALALGVVLLAGSGCAATLGDLRSAEGTRTPGARPGPAGGATPVYSETEFQEDIRTAQQIVDGYWRQHWNEYFTGVYNSPTVRGGYDGNNLATAPTCGGQPATKNNAFYCNPEDYIAWDTNLMRMGYAEGDAWVYLIIAHEWGHAVQKRLQDRYVAAAKELQADCLAGATLFGATEDGTLRIEPGDVNELVDSFKAVGDNTPWTNPNDHGDSLQRIEAFGKGRTGGVKACFASS